MGDHEWRVVIDDGLRVRSRPSTKGVVKAKLDRGTVVRFVEKRGRWTHIEFDDESIDGLAEGWVFNKHLAGVR